MKFSLKRVLKRGLLRVTALVAALALLALFAGFVVLRSGWFRERVRQWILAEFEGATGGKAEIGNLVFDPRTLTASVRRLVVHGTEAKSEEPLLTVDSAELGLRVLSVAKREFDLASLRVAKPRIHLIIGEDGSTNVPRRSATAWTDDVLSVKIGRYDIDAATLDIDGVESPFQAHGEGLAVNAAYDPQANRYSGKASSRAMRVAWGERSLDLAAAADFVIESRRLAFPKLDVRMDGASAQLAGSFDDIRTFRGAFHGKGSSSAAEIERLLGITLGTAAKVTAEGDLTVRLTEPADARWAGHVDVVDAEVGKEPHLTGVSISGDGEVDSTGAYAKRLSANALGATFTGSASLRGFRALHVEGTLADLDVRRASESIAKREVPWTGTIGGTVVGDADADSSSLRVDLAIAPGPTNPIDGHVAAVLDPTGGTIDLGSSYVATGATRLEASGLLGANMRVSLRTTNIDDLRTALGVAGWNQPFPLVLRAGGAIEASGTLAGTLRAPQFRGRLSVQNATFDGHEIDRFAADTEASLAAVSLRGIDGGVGLARFGGSLGLTARAGSFREAAVTGDLSMRGAPLRWVLTETGWDKSVASQGDVSGTTDATLAITGTTSQPDITGQADLFSPTLWGERLDQIKLSGRYHDNQVDLASGEAQDGPARYNFSGSYGVASGDVRFDLTATGVPASRIEAVSRIRPSVDARVTAKMKGAGKLTGGKFALSELGGEASADDLRLAGATVGSLALSVGTESVGTQGTNLRVDVKGKLKEASIDGQGSWRLDREQPGSATIRMSRLSATSARDLAELMGLAPASAADLPFDGGFESKVELQAALQKLDEARADVIVDGLRLTPKRSQVARLGLAVADIAIENEGPIEVSVNAHEARIRSARLRARDTSVEATGFVPLDGNRAAELNLNGSMNLATLQLFDADLLAKGSASLTATVRGSPQDPKLSGRLDLRGASLYLTGLANGIENANGTVTFDNRRATISKMTAETGGGTVQLGGYLEYAPDLTYRVTADAKQVRVRWPETLSTTASARLALNGTPSASTLSGDLTLERAAFAPNTDFGALLAEASQPIPAEPTDYLRGVQFDVRVRNTPGFELQTSLTKQLTPVVDLRLRGSPQRPVLLGNISVDQGEAQLFGNKYTIGRCNVRFSNPVKIEPAFDMALETVARGVNVNVTLSGTMQKQRWNYSSDPPLESQEIIALLAVGRDPTSQQGIVANQANATSAIETGGSLLSDAVTAQLTSRLQRFFGASRVKIDPKITGVENLPLARLTLEQQLSKDVTLTYITNLNRTQEQIVRVQWDLDRNWSAVAVRDSNGLFGIDFQYRKRLK